MSWADWDLKHPDIKRRAKNNFVGFKRREGMPEEHAQEEFDRIHAAGTGDNYMKSSRIGARFTANRLERQGHLQHFENAYNHASFEVRKMEFAKLLKGSKALAVTEVIKSTAGKHWKWHNKGSSAAVTHGETNGYKVNHTQNQSNFNSRPLNAEGVTNKAIAFHQHLLNNGFKQTGISSENLPWRDATKSTFQHPDGTEVTSLTNIPKDKSTEFAHDYAVFHPASSAQDAPPPAKNPATVPAAAQGTNSPADHMKVANTILQQYGGNKFRAMTGAHSFIASKEKGGALTFKLPKTAGATKGTKYVKTVHDPATDTYDVHMLGRNGDVKHTATGVYADQLQSHFKHHTGLDTHL